MIDTLITVEQVILHFAKGSLLAMMTNQLKYPVVRHVDNIQQTVHHIEILLLQEDDKQDFMKDPLHHQPHSPLHLRRLDRPVRQESTVDIIIVA